MRLSISEAEDMVVAILTRNKVAAGNARSTARALVAAEAAGQSGHGLRRVPAYAAQALAGKVDGFAIPVATKTAEAVLRIDAGFGFAYPALDMAVAELAPLAGRNGIALAAIHRSHHAGVMALTVERFAEQGLVALMVANAPAAMAPWGGRTAMFGTNPIAFAAPLAGADPVVIDLALSKAARGKIVAAKQKGVGIPPDWALDKDGHPTTDAAMALEGTMLPLGEAKGAALALMVEILAAGITGAQFAYEASSLLDDKGPPPALGQTIIVIDPQASGGGDMLPRLSMLAEMIGDDPGARLPGRRGAARRRQALAEGLELDADIMQLLHALP
ncbi:Ldh family oxidoreductase [Phyllobacterium sp. 0TCS1.6C]|uniref:Ldh family oxidoreductase n=1 Tax=unclassified Phyllobacterium TaxID=2638441 RepID=UPI002263C386|nr:MULTISPECIES: Ldh family oxidoreductase [unclassified Phyllobacterium]MCX8279334.1 Ldh family oxidoreductase [Phyllobacterium sp. 0TCS1.6C]MCX8294118.1 Ldh family oxidoreductase [Phyllobacterium sp. 0TCS1.6A]